MSAEESRIPATSPAELPAAETAVLVLDLTAHDDPASDRLAYLEHLGGFLERARASKVAICYTGIVHRRGEPVDPRLGWRDDEPLFWPAAYDKFVGGEIEQFLGERGSKSIVVTGAATNVAVLYTATTAARHLAYEVYVPVDGVFAEEPYRSEYALYNLSILPRPPRPVHFTTLGGLVFS